METIVFWDWNGTILDDVEQNHKILNSILLKRGLKQIDLDEYRRLFKMPIIDFYYSLGFTFTDESFEKIAIEYGKLYKDVFNKIPLMPGIKETLSSIKNKGIKQYIVSALNQKDLVLQVQEKEISHYFEKIVGIDNINAISKKQKAIDLVSSLDIKKSKMFFIGDMDHDYEVAKSIGAQCIIYNKGHQLIKSGSDYIEISNIRDVLDYL